MSGQDPSAMYGLEDSNSAGESSIILDGVRGNNQQQQLQQQQPQPQPQQQPQSDPRPDALPADVLNTEDTRSFYNPDSNWPFETPSVDQSSEGLYQPSSWDTSQQGVPAPALYQNPEQGANNQEQVLNPNELLTFGADALANLTPAQHRALRDIAMPPHVQYRTSSDGQLESPTGGGFSPSDPLDPTRAARKRKSSADDVEDEDEDDEVQPVKKTAHNMIEKRYRTNLNDKIAALRDSVPSLRIMSKSARGEDTTEDREELHGLTPAHKLNKATVLSKATEYIRHLEKRNNRLIDENNAMQQRIAAFEKLFMAGAMNGAISPLQQPPPMQYPGPTQSGSQPPQQEGGPSYMTPSVSSQGGGAPSEASAAGMIQVPEDMKRILQAQMGGQPYPVPQQPYNPNPALARQQQIQQMQQIQQNRWRNPSPYLGKLMVGSLAGLM